MVQQEEPWIWLGLIWVEHSCVWYWGICYFTLKFGDYKIYQMVLIDPIFINDQI